MSFFKFLEFIKVVNKLAKYAKIRILMVSSTLHNMSQAERTKKCSRIDSENKSVKRNTDHQNRLTVCFDVLP